MALRTILRRIDIWLAEHDGMTDAELSRMATGSTDTIRNWRRRVEREEDPGAGVKALQAIANAMRVPRSWLEGDGPDDLKSVKRDRKRLTTLYDAFRTEAFRQAAIRQIEALLDAEAAAAPDED